MFAVYNDPAFLAERHGITDQDERIGNITNAVAGLVAAATGTAGESTDP